MCVMFAGNINMNPPPHTHTHRCWNWTSTTRTRCTTEASPSTSLACTIKPSLTSPRSKYIPDLDVCVYVRVCIVHTIRTHTHNNARSLSLPLSLSRSFSLPPSLSLSLSHRYTHTHTPQAVRLDPQNASALFNRGSALDSLGIFVHAFLRARAHTHTHIICSYRYLYLSAFVSSKLTKRALRCRTIRPRHCRLHQGAGARHGRRGLAPARTLIPHPRTQGRRFQVRGKSRADQSIV